MNYKHLFTLALLTAALFAAAVHAVDPARIGLAFVGDDRQAAYFGVRQGLSEANLQGSFLGQEYSVTVVAPADAPATDMSPYQAIIVAGDAGLLQELARRLPDHPILNVTAGDNSLRSACIPNLLHVVPSDRMLHDAVAQWRQKHPDADVSASAWHPDFVKFAARDLNKRFRAAFNTAMDDQAWAGWAAVKMVSDMVARRGPETPAALLEHLRSDLAFDGQKGFDLSFRPTGQLRQLLLLSENGKLVGEAPVRGVAASDADLDSLGLVECPAESTKEP